MARLSSDSINKTITLLPEEGYTYEVHFNGEVTRLRGEEGTFTFTEDSVGVDTTPFEYKHPIAPFVRTPNFMDATVGPIFSFNQGHLSIRRSLTLDEANYFIVNRVGEVQRLSICTDFPIPLHKLNIDFSSLTKLDIMEVGGPVYEVYRIFDSLPIARLESLYICGAVDWEGYYFLPNVDTLYIDRLVYDEETAHVINYLSPKSVRIIRMCMMEPAKVEAEAELRRMFAPGPALEEAIKNLRLSPNYDTKIKCESFHVSYQNDGLALLGQLDPSTLRHLWIHNSVDGQDLDLSPSVVTGKSLAHLVNLEYLNIDELWGSLTNPKLKSVKCSIFSGVMTDDVFPGRDLHEMKLATIDDTEEAEFDPFTLIDCTTTDLVTIGRHPRIYMKTLEKDITIDFPIDLFIVMGGLIIKKLPKAKSARTVV